MYKYKYEFTVKNNGSTVIRNGNEVFNAQDSVYSPTYEKKTIKSFNIDRFYGGIRVDFIEGGEAALDCIHKTDDANLYLAKELLKHNGCSIKYFEAGNSIRIEGAGHSSMQTYYIGNTDIMIHGEAYIPLKKYLEDINKLYKGKSMTSEKEIDSAKELVEKSGCKVIDHRKMWSYEDMKKCYDAASIGVQCFNDYFNSIK